MRHPISTAVCLAVLVLTTPALALIPPDGSSPAAGLEFRHPDLAIVTEYAAVADLDPALADALAQDLATLGVDPANALYDEQTGRWVTLLQARPLIPGDGVGNTLAWGAGEEPADNAALADAARDAFLAYLDAHYAELAIDRAEVEGALRVTVHDGGRLIQISAMRHVGGVKVRDSYLTAVINSGNLVLMGVRNWADVTVPVLPALTADQAMETVYSHLGSLAVDRQWRKPHLTIAPLAKDPLLALPGDGLDFRLAWVLSVAFADDHGSWEALVDAQSGELLAFEDQNHYATTRKVLGGVLPITNDELTPDGQEQPGWPTPFADVTDAAGNTYVTDSGGNAPVCFDGDITTRLDSQYVRMLDQCNPTGDTTSVSSAVTLGLEDIDLGITVPFGTDCTPVTDPPSSAALGNTRASRTGFYEVNRIMEQARGQLPDNLWLQDQLTANMNIPNVCNAFWNGSTINFYRTSGACSNTGEIAGIFDHEWGHGMDNFDAAGFIARPGSEGIADAYMALRLNTSCVGRNFSSALGCNGPTGGNGDPCINDCNGVRDVNYHNRASGQPHGIAFALSNCGSAPIVCNGAVHCEGALVSEMIWDLAKRDLRCQGPGWVDDGPPFDGPVEGGECAGGASPTLDADTAFELATRLTYQGGGITGRWFECRLNGQAGCIADGAYLNYLAADDDNGSLADGTPHMTAIFAAFDRHDMACHAMPQPVVDSGCAGAPTQAPVVTATALDRAVRLQWAPVPNAQSYEIFRSEGLFGCDSGKTKVGTLDSALCGASCEFVAEELQNGFEYYFKVLPLGSSSGTANACIGPMNADCTTVTPGPGPNLGVDTGSAALTMLSGDGDIFLDNCEEARVTFDVVNTGAGTLTNVEIVDVRPVELPGFSVSTTFPAPVTASLAECGSALGAFEVTAGGMAFQDSFAFQVELTSDELKAQGLTRTFLVGFEGLAEGDFAFQASKTFDFESSLDNWIVERGTFNRTNDPPGPGNPGGAGGSSFLVASSSVLPGQCDKIRTPLLRLTGTSTLSLQNQWDIEGDGGTGTWYDRANVRVIDVSSGAESVVVPSSGVHPYNVPDGAANGTCDTAGQPGWAATSPNFGTAAGWGDANFDSAALGAGAIAGDVVRIGINYGTDPGAHLTGFWFDRVEITNFDLHVPDTQANSCIDLPPNAVDDAVTTPVDTPVVIAVLDNDDDPEGQPLAITQVQSPTDQGGSVVDNGDGTVTYTPPAGFSSPPDDTFTYEITDGGQLDTATVSVTVVIFNNPPSAVDDAATTTQGLATTIDVLANDSDADGDPLTVTFVESPTSQGGTAVDNGDGTVTYTPPAGFFSGPDDTFVYEISDGTDTAIATVSVTVEPACPAQPTGSFFDDLEGTDPGDDPSGHEPGWTFQTVQNTQNDNNWRVVTDLLAHSPDQAFSSDAINKPGVKDDRLISPPVKPSATSQLIFWHRFRFAVASTGASDGAVLEVCLTATNCSLETSWADIEASASFVQGGYNQTMRTNGNPGVITGRRAWSGNSTFIDAMDQVIVDLSAFAGSEIRLRWRNTGDNTIVIGSTTTDYFVDDIELTNLLEQGNCAPLAADDSAMTLRDTPVTIAVLANDSDPNGDPLAIQSVQSPTDQGGTAVDNGDGTVTYTPPAGFVGTDTFTYTVCDGGGLCDTATVTVTVKRDNLAPNAEPDGATTPKDTPVVITVLANDSDPDGDPIAIQSVQSPTDQGGTAVDNGDGTVTYTPPAGFVSPPDDAFTYTICDDGGLCDTAIVTVTVTDVVDPCPGEDDDDFDSDGVRDDIDSDDDSDGIPDDADSDDDNDGDSDDSDSDDDNDCIDDEFDGESSREDQSRESDFAPAAGENVYTLTATSATTLLVALAEGPTADGLTIEIHDPAGNLVATSVSTPGRALATAVPLVPGDYDVRVKNPGGQGVAYDLTLLTSQPW